MDHPYNGVRLRRHNSLPAVPHKLTPSSVVSTTACNRKSAQKPFRLRVPVFMSSSKTNPYIGSFRHAPPTSFTTMRSRVTDSAYTIPISGLAPGRKSSPYIGWFRHAPPTTHHCNQFHQDQRKRFQWLHDKVFSPSTNYFTKSSECQASETADLLKILQILEESSSLTTSNKLNESSSTSAIVGNPRRILVNGYLRGGGPRTKNSQYPSSSSVSSPLDDDESVSSASLKILTRLSSWFLFPLAYDAESCGYGGSVGKRPLAIKASQSPRVTAILESHDEDDYDSDDDEDHSDSSSTITGSVSYDREVAQPISPTKLSPLTLSASQLEVSVSEIAQAYHAHRATSSSSFDNDLETSGNLECNNPMEVSDLTTPFGGGGFSHAFSNPWDYVITQQDIARMARNASRHLDVESILHLPTITYRCPSRNQVVRGSREKSSSSQVTAPTGTITNSSKEFWSWMMVGNSRVIEEGTESQEQGSEATITNAQRSSDAMQQDHVCVICLEHFVDGDRLRVLPCNHSFHVGCIDRWLSGSHSHHECFTSGCPTCKAHPRGSSSHPAASVASSSIIQEPVSSSSTLSSPPVYRVVQEDNDDNINDLNGSVPSWAFTQLGSAMARSANSSS